MVIATVALGVLQGGCVPDLLSFSVISLLRGSEEQLRFRQPLGGISDSFLEHVSAGCDSRVTLG